jgi:AmmeMemoRadiSam system protein B
VNESTPTLRRDLEFFPVQHEGKQLVLVRDHLDLVQEGKAVAVPLYQLMTLLDGTRSLRDIQMVLMQQQGGVLVSTDEVMYLLAHLDEAFLLDSKRFRGARDRIMKDFESRSVRPCSHCGRAYPDHPQALKERLQDILESRTALPEPKGEIIALAAPHIDLSVGYRAYSRAYQNLGHTSPSRILVLGVGHQMGRDLFSLTEKAFETPLGVVKTDRAMVRKLREAGPDIVADTDFAHRSEHSIEFQLLFLQHLLGETTWTIVPVLCGFFQACLADYSREAYLDKAGPFLEILREALSEPGDGTLVVAGVDFSHVGPKFGHEMPAHHLTAQSEAHDRRLLECLCGLETELFWEESRRVGDQFNVCGFSALACLQEILPPCRGSLLHYETWHEEATRSAVSFGSVVFERREYWSTGGLE